MPPPPPPLVRSRSGASIDSRRGSVIDYSAFLYFSIIIIIIMLCYKQNNNIRHDHRVYYVNIYDMIYFIIFDNIRIKILYTCRVFKWKQFEPVGGKHQFLSFFLRVWPHNSIASNTMRFRKLPILTPHSTTHNYIRTKHDIIIIALEIQFFDDIIYNRCFIFSRPVMFTCNL